MQTKTESKQLIGSKKFSSLSLGTTVKNSATTLADKKQIGKTIKMQEMREHYKNLRPIVRYNTPPYSGSGKSTGSPIDLGLLKAIEKQKSELEFKYLMDGFLEGPERLFLTMLKQYLSAIDEEKLPKSIQKLDKLNSAVEKFLK